MEDILPLLHKSVKAKRYELLRSIQGHFTADHAFTLSLLLETVDYFEQNINAIDKQIKIIVSEIEPLIRELKKVPGLSETTIYGILAEIGFSLEEFPKSNNLGSWAGLCPGNNQSAGKRKSGRSPVHNHPLKTILVEAAWAAVKKRGSYFKDKYYSLKSRTNPKKAIIAIAHKLLKVIYNIVKHGQEYKELGEDYLCRNNEKAKLKKLQAQASKLGMKLIPINA